MTVSCLLSALLVKVLCCNVLDKYYVRNIRQSDDCVLFLLFVIIYDIIMISKNDSLLYSALRSLFICNYITILSSADS